MIWLPIKEKNIFYVLLILIFSFPIEMLSRLSGLANIVLHELSRNDNNPNMRASLDPVSSSVLN